MLVLCPFFFCVLLYINYKLSRKGDVGAMDQQKIGTFLKELRNEKKLTQEQLAEKLGVSRRTVSRWETGINMPDLDILIEMADYYDVDLRELLDGERQSEEMARTSIAMCEDKKDFKERLGATIKRIIFSRKAIVLSSAFLVLILCGAFYFSAASGTSNTKNGDIVAYIETPFERQRHVKEIELTENIRNFDKENIVDVWTFLGSSDNEITYANIFIVSQEEIINKDELMLLASENLNLDIKNIYIESMDVEEYTSREKVR